MAYTNSHHYSTLYGTVRPAKRSALLDEGINLCVEAKRNLEQAESFFKRAEGVDDTIDAVRMARAMADRASKRAMPARAMAVDEDLAKDWVFNESEADTAVVGEGDSQQNCPRDQDKSAQATRKKKRVNILTPRQWLRRCWCKRQKADTAEADTAVQEQPPWNIEEELTEHCDDWEDDPEDLCGPEPLMYGRSRC